MKKTMSFAAAIVALSFAGGVAQAGCDLFEHFDHGGEKLALKDGECAIFAGDSDAACEGATPKIVEGWDDRVSSVVLNHNSVALMKDNADGSGEFSLIQGNRGVKSLDEAANDKASLVICRQP